MGTPYIGSKINLISKFDIRYEGILYTVDTADSTIALSKVRSFGTEDRQTENPVAARDNVYECIIFKASDIKDLIVCETPAPPTAHGLDFDPAIVSVKSTVPPLHGEGDPAAGSSRSSPRASPAQGQQRTPTRSFNRGAHRGYAMRQPNAGMYHPRGHYNNRGGYQHQRTGNPPAPTEKVKFDGDYDFEKANTEFTSSIDDKLQALTIGKEKDEDAAVVELPDEQPAFYDKKSSFFDSISCEALEKQEGRRTRPDWKKERETNQETFGQTAVRSFNYRRGYGRGMRGSRYPAHRIRFGQ
ncbi:unnamed protein product, partial [Mesorhabditis spiculigera]